MRYRVLQVRKALFFCLVVPLIAAIRGLFSINSQIDDWKEKCRIRDDVRGRVMWMTDRAKSCAEKN